MSDNNVDVILVTSDSRLQRLVTRHKPPGATLRCIAPANLEKATLPPTTQCWCDLDSGTVPDFETAGRRVYFYSQLPENPAQLPTGLFLRKPSAGPIVAVLWAAVASPQSHPPLSSRCADPPQAARLPAWLLDLHRLDLREFCHACVEKLPAHLGYTEIALYLYDNEQQILALAETNSQRHIELAVPLTPDHDHLLAVVARGGEPLITDNLAEACRARGVPCPPTVLHEPHHAAVIAPLATQDKLHGLLWLGGRCGPDLSQLDLQFDRVLDFLARCLQHARRYLRARVEARVDRLTGLFNYRWMIEALGKEIRRAQRYGSPLALCMIDLDGLKTVNDRFGHLAGDALLRHTAAQISAALRQIDSAARIGGDEFVVLLPATNLNGARHVARRILTAIRNDAPVINQQTLPVAASLGVAQWQSGWDESQLIAAADRAMYAAKREGHNRLVCHPYQNAPRSAAPTTA